jgi:hypothetical protein
VSGVAFGPAGRRGRRQLGGWWAPLCTSLARQAYIREEISGYALSPEDTDYPARLLVAQQQQQQQVRLREPSWPLGCVVRLRRSSNSSSRSRASRGRRGPDEMLCVPHAAQYVYISWILDRGSRGYIYIYVCVPHAAQAGPSNGHGGEAGGGEAGGEGGGEPALPASRCVAGVRSWRAFSSIALRS